MSKVFLVSFATFFRFSIYTDWISEILMKKVFISPCMSDFLDEDSLYIYEMLIFEEISLSNSIFGSKRIRLEWKFTKENQRDYFSAYIATSLHPRRIINLVENLKKKPLHEREKGEHVKLRKSFQMKFLCMLFSALKFSTVFHGYETSFVCARREHFFLLLPWF